MWPSTKADRSHPAYTYMLIGGYAIAAVLLFLLFGTAFFGPSDQEPAEVIPASNQVNQGGRIVAVQFPALSTRGDLTTVFEDGQTSRSFVPSAPDDPSSHQALAPEQRQAIEDLRAEWCRNPPRSMQPYDYDIGFQCANVRARRVLLPKDGLPPALATLLETGPSPE